eukprot:gene8274-8462_t
MSAANIINTSIDEAQIQQHLLPPGFGSSPAGASSLWLARSLSVPQLVPASLAQPAVLAVSIPEQLPVNFIPTPDQQGAWQTLASTLNGEQELSAPPQQQHMTKLHQAAATGVNLLGSGMQVASGPAVHGQGLELLSAGLPAGSKALKDLFPSQLMAMVDWLLQHYYGKKANKPDCASATAVAAAAADLGQATCKPDEALTAEKFQALCSLIRSSSATQAAGAAADGSMNTATTDMPGGEVLAAVAGLQEAANLRCSGPQLQLIDDILPSMQDLLTDCS